MKKIFATFTLVLIVLTISAQQQGFDNFVTTKGKDLMDGDKVYRFVSMNIPNLNYVEDEMTFNREHPYRYPNEFEIRDAFETVKQMGGKVIRIYTLPVKRSDESDNVPAFVTGPGKFVEKAFVVNDLMLKIANETGVRIIFSFLNNWKWMGGVPQYSGFRGKKFDDFWVDPQLIEDFKKTIEFTINRTNTLTGVKYRDDKSIMCWETGNELVCPYSWVKEIAAYVKSLDQNHLLMDGYHAIDHFRYVYEESVNDPNIDILSSHHYEQNPFEQVVNIQKNLDIIKGRKPYVLGELGFESTTAHNRIYNMIIDNKDIAGTLNWSIRSHRREGGFYWHSEPVGHNLYKAYHWPGFVSGYQYDEIGLLTLIREMAYKIDGEEPPALPKPKAPKLLPIDKVYKINWQGSVGASGYNIERAESKNGEWKQIAYHVSDADVPYFDLFNDKTAKIGKSYFYRIEATNASGISPKSNVVGPVLVQEKALVDKMGNMMTVYMAKGVTFDTEFDRKFKEDMERMVGDYGSEIIYHVQGTLSSLNIYSFEQEKEVGLKLQVSIDGKTYNDIDPEILGNRTGTGDYDYWDGIKYQVSELSGANEFLKITYHHKAQIGRVELMYK
ncbi:hypothetical protein ACT3CE_01465 [Marinifilum sp. RC60d5]|uniref:hypothetical protein n=1 Tax=Marinifilum sp. RC60d5 TaxID=3458414 RepID=UPI004036ABC6